MDRRTFLGTPAFGAASLIQGAPQPAPAAKPNVIWLFGDQHRAQAVACNGDPNVRTPNMDNLAASGVNFTSAVSSFPLCCPFRGSLVTGRYAHHCVPGHEYPIPEGQPTIANVMRDNGYRTAWFGKWHLGGFHERDGRGAMFIVPPHLRGGFETWVGYENNNSQWDSWVHGGTGKDAFHYRLPGYETDALTDLLIKYVRERGAEARAAKAQPFFAALSVQPPHNPYIAPEAFRRNYNPAQLKLRPNVPPIARVEEQARRDLAGYYGMIENWDWNIGRVRQALDEAGLTFNTHLCIFSDHGDMHGSHGMTHKTNPYEESTRIPFIISGEQPFYTRGTGRPEVPLNTVDIAPTTLGLCGISKPNWMEGADLSHLRIRRAGGRAAEPDSAYLQSVVPTGHGDSINKPYRGIVTRDGWKYVAFERTSWLMFNLEEDPYELANVAHNSRYRAERRKLIARLKQWAADTGDKFELPED
jgi:arylsulfatase A-like enzyme